VRVGTVVKLGGSLVGDPSLRALLAALHEACPSAPLVVVPGGGPFADAVREACALQSPGESAAHWMAVLAMDQYAHYLAGLQPGARVVDDEAAIGAALSRGELPVFAPYTWLRAVDPLPHTFKVTSDSIAACAASRFEASRLVLLKSVDGVPDGAGGLREEVSPAECGELVDEFFVEALPPLDCWILNGRYPERLVELLRGGRTRGTRIV
jgi:aspartokinase-like uncharacterized kinase